jgi:hypothetical protein
LEQLVAGRSVQTVGLPVQLVVTLDTLHPASDVQFALLFSDAQVGDGKQMELPELSTLQPADSQLTKSSNCVQSVVGVPVQVK